MTTYIIILLSTLFALTSGQKIGVGSCPSFRAVSNFDVNQVSRYFNNNTFIVYQIE